MNHDKGYFIIQRDYLTSWGSDHPMTLGVANQIIEESDGEDLVVIYGQLVGLRIQPPTVGFDA